MQQPSNLQDRLVDDGCNPGTCWGGDANSDTYNYCYCYCDTNSNGDSHSYGYTYGNSYADWDLNTDSYPKAHTDAKV